LKKQKGSRHELSYISEPCSWWSFILNCHIRRSHLRAVLEQESCLFPASVFDPLSARMAEHLGFELGMLAGSVASWHVLGAPDQVVLTLTELAETAHRICRASDIPLLVDADHGFGNALNVRRTVVELEDAGVSGLTIEDTELPQPYAKPAKGLIDAAEAMGKFQAALDARSDPLLCVFARTTALSNLPLNEALERIALYNTAKVDGLFLVGVQNWEQLRAIRAITSLPLLLGSTPKELKDPRALAQLNVKVALEGHSPFNEALRATFEELRRLRERVAENNTAPIENEKLLKVFTKEADYQQWIKTYLNPPL